MIYRDHRKTQSIFNRPLFAWAEQNGLQLSDNYSCRVIRRRYGFPLHVAKVIAENAGLRG